MKTVEELIREYIPASNIMQLATSKDNKPWLCTVHMFSDEDLNLYWFSTEERRHSKDIASNNNVAAYILVHENTEEENWVIGIAIEGTAEKLPHAENEAVIRKYQTKLRKPDEFVQDVLSGKNPHVLYKLTPLNFALFDTKNFQNGPRQEWRQNA